MTMADYVEFDPDGDVVLILRDKDESTGQAAGESHSKSTDQAEDPAHVDDGSEVAVVRMRVSSSHLILVSPFFRRLLKGPFAESNALSSAGTAEITLPEDDSQALHVLLNIIHGHTKKVPRAVNIGMLTQIAVLIDKYCLHEVAEVFTDMWFDKLREDIPQSFTEELMPWLCISWVLRKPKFFKDTTKIAMQESEGHLEGATKISLPIPAKVLGQYQSSHRFTSPR